MADEFDVEAMLEAPYRKEVILDFKNLCFIKIDCCKYLFCLKN